MGSHLPCADGPPCSRGAKLTDRDVVLSRSREASSSSESCSGYLCAEFGWDIELYLSKIAVSGLVLPSSG